MSDAALFEGLREEFGTQQETAKADKRLASNIYEGLFREQQQVIDDRSRRKAIICPRRAGKSYTALGYAYYVALTKPWSNILVIGLTLKSLKGVYWGRVLPLFERQFGIQTTKHFTDMRVRFDNSSTITFTGAETRAEIDKLRGQAYDLVIIDEAASFSPSVLEELVYDVLGRAMVDRKGTLMMIGTPGTSMAGSFYLATYQGAVDKRGIPYSKTYTTPEPYWIARPNDRSYRWSRHSWTVAANVSIPHAWEEALEEKQREGWPDNHPVWLREYMGQWVATNDSYVYAYASLVVSEPSRVQWEPERNRENKSGLPSGHEYRYIMGLDLGFEDDFALVVGAYSLTDGHLYHVYDLKLQHQDVHQIAGHVQEVVHRFDNKIDAIVADNAGLGKMVVETLNRWHGLNIQPAEKREKFDFIELMNADFHSGKVRIIPDSDLDIELRTLQWDLSKHTREELVRTNRLRENPSLPNHLCDAWLYLWRYSYHTYATPAKPALLPGTPEHWEAWERASIERMFQVQDALDRQEIQGLPNSDPLESFYGDRYRH